YRRCKGPGRWQVRVADGEGGYWFSVVGVADDHEEADGEHVLSWFQAQDRARRVARGSEDRDDKPATLAEALDTYERDPEARGANVANAQRPRHHLTAKLLAKPVMLLTAKELRGWRDRLSDGGMKAATLNRHLRALKAALTLAAAHDPERVTNRD